MLPKIPFEPNMEGIFPDVPQDVYRKAPGVAHTQMKYMDPPARQLAYMKSLDDPDDKREKWELRLGSIIHERIMEPENSKLLCVHPAKDEDGDDWAWRKKKNKEWRDSKEAEGFIVVSPDQRDQIYGIVDSIMANKLAAQWIERSMCELSVFSRNAATGVMWKARPDIIADGWNHIADIKTVLEGGSSKHAWNKRLFDYGYWTQAPWHMDVFNEQCDAANVRDEFAHIIVEKVPPYLCRISFVSKEDIALGRRVNAMRLQRYMECEQSGHWPGYPEVLERSEIPGWARFEMEQQLKGFE